MQEKKDETFFSLQMERKIKNEILKELLRLCTHNEGMVKERRHSNEKK